MAAKQQSNIDQELVKIEALKEKYSTPEVVYCGACTRKNWKSGQQITEKEYTKAVEEFLKAPLGRNKNE